MKSRYHPNLLYLKAGPFPIELKNKLKKGIGKLAYLKVDIGKILGKFPWISKVPLQGNGMAAIPKISICRSRFGAQNHDDFRSILVFSINRVTRSLEEKS